MARRPNTEAGRLEPIATLPVFLKLRGRRVLLVGGGAPAVWKAELLSAAGARVDIVAEEPGDDLVALAARPPDGPVTLHRRPWTVADLTGAAIALGSIEDEGEATRFRDAARAAGVPVNVIDKPAFCDFQFGTFVSRTPLMVGISTDGAAPVFGQAIRTRIEALLPQGMQRWAEAARDWRPALQERALPFRARRRFWEVFAERAMRASDAAPTADDEAACLAAASGAEAEPARVTLVGAGAGDADGITLGAIKALQDADRVFFGEEVSPTLVGYARREAPKQMLVAASAAATVIAAAVTGHTVWLDTGNPFACRRWSEREGTVAQGFAGAVGKVAGLGRCETCTPQCPSYAQALPACEA